MYQLWCTTRHLCIWMHLILCLSGAFFPSRKWPQRQSHPNTRFNEQLWTPATVLPLILPLNVDSLFGRILLMVRWLLQVFAPSTIFHLCTLTIKCGGQHKPMKSFMLNQPVISAKFNFCTALRCYFIWCGSIAPGFLNTHDSLLHSIGTFVDISSCSWLWMTCTNTTVNRTKQATFKRILRFSRIKACKLGCGDQPSIPKKTYIFKYI